MANSYYRDDDSAGITDINITPFVDVVLVLLVVFMVTAKLIVSRGIEVDKPKAATGGDVESPLRVSITADGSLFVNGSAYQDDAAAIARIKELAAASAKPKALIAGDRASAYDKVMHAIDLVQQAGVAAIALENVAP